MVDQATQGRASARVRRVCVQGLGCMKMIKSSYYLFLITEICQRVVHLINLQVKVREFPKRSVKAVDQAQTMSLAGLA